MRFPWPAIAALVLLVMTAPACTPPPTQELALADMVPRGDAIPADAPLSTVYFDVGSATLSDEALAALDGFMADPGLRDWTLVTLAAHADTSGSARHNRRLAAARADAVRRHLVTAGVPAAIIVIKVFGERLARSGSAAEDRRVDIFVEP